MLIVTTLCMAFQICSVIGVKVTRTTQHVDFGQDVKPDAVLISDTSNYANPGLVYGVCNVDSSLSEYFVCQMFMQNHKNVRACNVTVKRLRPGYSVRRSVVALDDDTAVMIPREYYSSSLTFVHFPDCRTRIVDLDYDLASAKVLAPLDNVFDLIGVEGGDKCFSDCRVTMDFNGSVILKAHKWLRSYQNEYVGMQSPIRGRLLVGTPSVFLETAVRISAVGDDGNAVTLKTYQTDANASIRHQISASTTHQLLTTCVAVKSNVTCGQFDFMGTLISETNLTIKELTHLHSIKVFNLPEGGFLLLYAKCLKNNSETIEDECQDSRHDFFATKIDFTGKRVGTFEVTQFEGNAVLERMHFYVSEEDGLCFSQPYLAGGFEENCQLNLDIVCFNSTTFSDGLP